LLAKVEALQIEFSADDLRPIVEEIVATLADKLTKFDDRLSVDEREAARLLGVPRSALRDARTAGKIKPSAKIGKRWLYTRKDLLRFLSGKAA